MKKPPHEKLGISEVAYNLCFTSGYNSTFMVNKPKCPHKKGTPYRKAYDAGKRATKLKW